MALPPQFLKKSGGDKSGGSGSEPPAGGLRFKSDSSLPAGQRAVVDAGGKRLAVVKKIGDKWCGSWDSYSQKFDTPQAALKHFAMTKKLGKGGASTKPGAVSSATSASK